MKDHFSARNAEWVPGLVLYAWQNSRSLGSSNGSRSDIPLRDPTKGPRPLKEQVEYLGRFMLLQLLRVLTVAGAPLAWAFEALISLRSGLTAIALEFKRIIAGFIGYQAQKVPRSPFRILNWDFLPDFRRWHVSLGALYLVLLVPTF